MQITEPVTMATDYLLSALSFFWAIRLWRAGQSKVTTSAHFWGLALVMLGISAFVGGTAHGFTLYMGKIGQIITWKTTVYSIGLTGFFMLVGTTIGSVKNPAQRIILLLAGLQFAIFAAWMISHNDFLYVVIDYVPIMLAVCILQIIAHVKRQQKSAIWLICGVLVSFTAAGIQISGLDLHKYFNHNDFYHVVQMVGVYLFYRGAALLEDKKI